MNKYLKYFYKIIPFIFIFLTLIEFIIYLISKSNLFGVLYLIINMFITFILLTISKNFEKGKINIRLSKMLIIIILGLFSNFLLNKINFTSYIEINNFYDNIFLISRVFKTIIYSLLVALVIYERK